MLRPVSIARFLTAMRQQGYADATLLANTAIDASALSNPEYFISFADHHTFLANMIKLTGDNGIGLRLGQMAEAAHYGILAYTGLSCGSIRDGIQNVWSRYGAAFGVRTQLSIQKCDPQFDTIIILTPMESEQVYRFQIEEALCVLQKIGGALIGSAPELREFTLAYPPPAYAAAYKAAFGREPRFNAAVNSLTVAREWLDRPLTTLDAELNRVGRDYMDRILTMSLATESITARLRQYLLLHIGNAPTLEETAREFGMSPRTLARHLAEVGCSYRQVLEDLRFELAQHWLHASSKRAKEVAFRLGYQDVPAFRRAFKIWTGRSIGDWNADAHGYGRTGETAATCTK